MKNIPTAYSDRRVLITGASRGVGAALTEWLADNGAHVLAVGRSTENLSRSRVEYLALDLSSQENTSKLVQHANEFEPDTVVHALGGGFGLSNDLVTPEDFLHLVQLNFLVSLQINNSLLPNMVAKQQGWIVHLGTVATRELTASVGYTCAKALITPYVKHMGRKLVCDGVYISGITLGAVTGQGGAIDRLKNKKPDVFRDFMKSRRPSARATPLTELMPYFNLLLTDSAKLHASNMLCIDEAEGVAI